jgi:hypothetical protein
MKGESRGKRLKVKGYRLLVKWGLMGFAGLKKEEAKGG